MRPKSEIYTPKRDDEHPHPFYMRSPSPGKRDCSKSSKLAFYDVKTQPSLWPAHYHEQLWPHRCQHTYSSLYFKSHEMRHLKWKFRFLTLSVWYNRKGLAVSWKSLFWGVETCPLKARVIFIILANRKIKKGLCQSITCRPQSVLAILHFMEKPIVLAISNFIILSHESREDREQRTFPSIFLE